jgi:hypothetical protein
MNSADASKLQGWVSTATQWHANAQSAGLALDQINLRTSDGLPMILVWQDQVVDETGGVISPAQWRIVAP